MSPPHPVSSRTPRTNMDALCLPHADGSADALVVICGGRYIGLPGSKHLKIADQIRTKHKIEVTTTRRAGMALAQVIYWYDKTHVVSTKFYSEFVYGGGSGAKIPLGQFTEHTLGVAERQDIIANGMGAHARYGTYQVEPELVAPVIEHVNGQWRHQCRPCRPCYVATSAGFAAPPPPGSKPRAPSPSGRRWQPPREH